MPRCPAPLGVVTLELHDAEECAVAAAEVVVGLAIIVAVYRARRSASVDDANLLKL